MMPEVHRKNVFASYSGPNDYRICVLPMEDIGDTRGSQWIIISLKCTCHATLFPICRHHRRQRFIYNEPQSEVHNDPLATEASFLPGAGTRGSQWIIISLKCACHATLFPICRHHRRQRFIYNEPQSEVHNDPLATEASFLPGAGTVRITTALLYSPFPARFSPLTLILYRLSGSRSVSINLNPKQIYRCWLSERNFNESCVKYGSGLWSLFASKMY